MASCIRNFAVAGVALVATAGAMAQSVGGDSEPDITTKLKAVQVYMEDGSAVILAQACTETVPDFMSEFLPKFTGWRTTNAKQIALGATLSAQFKDPHGEPMDPTVLGHAAAEKLRTVSPDERSRQCKSLLRDISSDD